MGWGAVSGPSSLKHKTYRVPSCSVVGLLSGDRQGRLSYVNAKNRQSQRGECEERARWSWQPASSTALANPPSDAKRTIAGRGWARILPRRRAIVVRRIPGLPAAADGAASAPPPGCFRRPMGCAGAMILRDMTERAAVLQPFEVLIGSWSTEATHPLVDEVVPGTITFEWFEGGHFVVQRSSNDHELFPDAISIIGAPEAGDGLVMEYFDSRSVRRTYGVSLTTACCACGATTRGSTSASRPHSNLTRSKANGSSRKSRGDWHDDLKVIYWRRD